MRLDKFLSNSGIGSRKEVKEYLKKRKIVVNEKIVIDGSIHIDENVDEIKYENKILSYKPFIYIMLNKPNGVISATEDKEHKTVIDLLENNYKGYGLFPVGRLDIDTEGLLLITNDGKLAHNLLSPKKHINKKYYVEVRDNVTDEMKYKLENGIELDKDFITKNAKIEIIKNAEVPINIETGEKTASKVYITITEGKFHQVKRMFRAVGNRVIYLKRVKMGNLSLDENLKIGEYRELTAREVENLL